ncbi:hypothetical protein CONPUDRAFT_72901 [Coniophora puteana RWD-64-598 SS2]|uniref:Uncharacterized protein n=1 Tax=Coniophora puteana (strain RWD-64-598) TaxID=741705 RepID=A0A5M3MRB6_CONPW|nr:uncharacterized protein CONPUDRAFT_72901 [Coniophora puteana RWD-64-598 SS2]EIW81081.1 hypothetical protein CONPUDRAFT_72901 [Coniophora puteana RWD-64-598 SS2]
MAAVRPTIEIPQRSYVAEASSPTSSITLLNDDPYLYDKYDLLYASTKCTFNPQASEFVPSNTPLAHISQHIPSKHPLSCPDFPSGFRPEWYAAFEAGIQAPLEEITQQDHLSSVLSHEYTWNATSLKTLAQHFLWMASEDIDSQSGARAAVFAKMFADKLGQTSIWDSSCFLHNLRDVTCAAVKMVWDPLTPDRLGLSGTQTDLRCIAHPQNTSLAYVTSATTLLSFLGALYNEDLLERKCVLGLLTLVLQHTYTFEYVCGMHALVAHAGPRLWRFAGSGKTMRDFATALGQRVSSMDKSASLLGGMCGQAQIRPWSSDMCRTIAEWQKERIASTKPTSPWTALSQDILL